MSYPVATTPNPSVHVTRPSGSAPMSPQQWEAYGTALVDEFLAQVLMAVASIDVVGTHPFAGLQQWATQLDQAAQNALLSAQGAQSTANGAYGDFQNYVSGNYTGITTPMAGLIPASRIVNTTPNLQVDPAFDTTAAIAGSADWTLDTTQGHTSPGSAVTTANGTDRSLLGTIVPVQVGNVISLEVWAMWAALAAPSTATPIQLQIETDSGSTTLIAGLVDPAASASWTQLTGSYTVPAGVAWVRLRLLVTGDATSGQVWVDDASIILSGGFLDALSSDTQNVISALTAGGTSGQVSEAWNNLLGLFSLTPANMTAGALNAQTVWTNTINTVIADLNLLVATGDYHPLLNALFGSTATPNGSSTLSHTVMPLGWQNLGNDISRIIQDILAGLGLSPTGSWGDMNAAFTQLETDLGFTLGIPSLPTTPTIHSTVLPAGWQQFGADFHTLINDLLAVVGMSDGHGNPANIGADVQQVLNDVLASPPTVPALPAAATIPQASVSQSSGWLSTAAANTQSVVDAINNSVTGGTGTGTSVGTVQANLQQIPQANVKINPNAGAQPAIVVDAVGAGNSYGAFSSSTGQGAGATITWSHTVGANANAVVVLASLGGSVAANTMLWMVTATPQSGAAVSLLQLPDAPTSTAFMVFGGNLAPGTYTISLTGILAMNGATAQSVPGFAGVSISYQNVRLFGVDITSATGTSSKPSLTAAAPTSNPMVVGLPCLCNVATTASAATLSTMTGATSRLAKAFTAGSSGIAFMVGDTAAATQGTFGATVASTSSNQWAAFEILLQPSFTPTGSYAELARRSSSPVSMAAGTSPLPAGALDTVIALSSDLTVVGSGVRVSLAGLYCVQFGVMFSTAPTGSFLSVGVLVNGAATDAGTYQPIMPTAGYMGLVYLNVGDVVSVQVSVGSAWAFMGSGGNLTYLRVGLANRSLH